MGFAPLRWPNAVTIAWLIEQGEGVGVHCMKCARFVVMEPASLPFARETPLLALGGRYKCTRCGSTDTKPARRQHVERLTRAAVHQFEISLRQETGR